MNAAIAVAIALAFLAVGMTFWRARKDQGFLETSVNALRLLDAIEAQCWLVDDDGVVLQSNDAVERFANEAAAPGGLGPGANLKSFLCESGLYGGDAASVVEGKFDAVVSGYLDRIDADVFATINGDRRDFRVTMTRILDASQSAVLVVQQDVTQERTVQRRLIESKRKTDTFANALETVQSSLELAMHGSGMGLWHWDLETGYFELSRHWLPMLGQSDLANSADIESFRGLVHLEDRAAWSRDSFESIGPDAPLDHQFRLLKSDGGWSWTHAVGRPSSLDEDGAPRSCSGIFVDIDARRRAELRSMGLATIIEESLNEVYVFDATTYAFTEVNRGARENLGYTLDELKGMTPWQLKPEFDRTRFVAELKPLLSGQEARLEFNTLHMRKDGTTYPVHVNLQLSQLMGRDVYCAIVLDLSEREQLEQQLRQAQKLESVGQLAAGVAHEINTPLQFIGNNVRYLSNCMTALLDVVDGCGRLLEESASERASRFAGLLEAADYELIRSEAPAAIADSEEGIDRVLTIVRALREFSHMGRGAMKPADIGHAIESTIAVTKHRWKEVAKVDYTRPQGLPLVECDEAEIKQVLLNLLINAVDAIEARKPSSVEGAVSLRATQEGNHVLIEIEDNGCGMDEWLLERMFDPFFTTKEIGKGTGQGLSICHRVVCQRHHGALVANSTPDVGTIFHVRLPIAQGAAAHDDSLAATYAT